MMKKITTGGCRTLVARRLAGAVGLGASLLLVATAVAQRGVATPPPNLGDLKTQPTAPVKEPTDPARLASLIGPQLRANHPAKANVQPGAPSLDITQVYYDEPGDGTLWARGRTYKCSFSADGFTFIPFMGSDAPQNYPVTFALSGIDASKGAIALTPPHVSRDGNRVVIDRGAVQEVYLLSVESVEQQFIFATRPSAASLTLNLDVQTELTAADSGDAIQLANDIGGFSYSKAVTIDSESRLGIAPTTLRPGGDIDIHLPQSLLASSTYPLTVDPTLVVYDVVGSTSDDSQSDIVYDTTDDGYTIVWEHNFSATDGDIYCERYDYDGTQIAGSLVFIDLSSLENWRKPRIANASIVNRNLVVAEVGAVGSRQVWGRTREAGSNTMSGKFQISDGAFAGEQFDPDVGGDSYTVEPPVYFGVVWQRNFTAADTDILFRLVDSATSAVSGAVVLIENSGGTLYHNPSISKTANTIEWNVVYQFTDSPTDEDIYATKVSWNGGINQANYGIDTTSINNTNPAVSGTLTGAPYMVVYEEDPTGAGDIYARVYNGTTMQTESNLTTSENVNTGDARRRPHIDNNDDHLIVSYEQQFFGADWDPYYSVYCYDGSIRLSEQHRNLDYTLGVVGSTRVSATYSSGSPFDPDEFGITWNTDGSIEASYGVARNSCCRSDVDSDTGDGTTDVNDLLIVINQWGNCTDTSICAGDIDGDLDVDVDDLLMVINAWGPCP